ncbi:TnsA-like heteromeric transposase endonuclease subunit [Arthrobacter cryoconiti]|uniref:TnsA-like heteromeric transposase endonuclease subunit n=1 Tax=Arthrobacter cryoconiti TaxID=748907 RepID=A0ABV8R1L5_9MICC|nr:TnsA-like heteromeric transposase endonuclease subunit [Arthrobacter cryoconiti]MCC9067777.1 TnsA-like heteromeric transposase endonuclease subunit [Arthrobacter cryoconiti]
MAGVRGQDVRVQHLSFDRSTVSARLEDVDVAAVLHGLPVRKSPTYRGQRIYPGLFWSATTRSFLIYESLLKLDYLWTADLLPTVDWIATQRFELSGRFGGRDHRHVPDVMVRSNLGRILIVDVKPKSRLDDPETAAVFDSPGDVCSQHGWDYEVWSGTSETVLRNIKLLACARVSTHFDRQTAMRAINECIEPLVFADLVRMVRAGVGLRSASSMTLNWPIWCRGPIAARRSQRW